jgi:hypothetical protein
LDNGVVGLLDSYEVAETLLEEEYLKGKRPPSYVVVIVFKVRVTVNDLEAWLPVVVACQHLGECGLPASDVACYGDVHSFAAYGLILLVG